MTFYMSSANTASSPSVELRICNLSTEASARGWCFPKPSDPVNELYTPDFLTQRDADELRGLNRATTRGRLVRTRP